MKPSVNTKFDFYKRMEKGHASTNLHPLQTGVAILISGKVDSRAKNVTKDEENNFKIIKGSFVRRE